MAAAPAPSEILSQLNTLLKTIAEAKAATDDHKRKREERKRKMKGQRQWYDEDDCPVDEPGQRHSLADLEVTWSYPGGHRRGG